MSHANADAGKNQQYDQPNAFFECHCACEAHCARSNNCPRSSRVSYSVAQRHAEFKEPAMPDEINLPPPLSLKVFSNARGICAKCGTRIDGSREHGLRSAPARAAITALRTSRARS